MGTKMATRSFWCLFVKVYTIKVGPKQNTAFILLFESIKSKKQIKFYAFLNLFEKILIFQLNYDWKS